MYRTTVVLGLCWMIFCANAKMSHSGFNIVANDLLGLHRTFHPQHGLRKEKVPEVMHRLYHDIMSNVSCVDQVVKSIPVELTRKGKKILVVPVSLELKNNQTLHRAELWLQFAANTSSRSVGQSARESHRLTKYLVDINTKDSRIMNLSSTTSLNIYDSKMEMGIDVTETYVKARSLGKKKLLLRLSFNPQEGYLHQYSLSNADAYLVLHELPGNVDKESIKDALYKRMRRSPKTLSRRLTKLLDRRFRKGSKSKRQCRLRKFYVTFEDLGWDDWVLAPPIGYWANRCSGVCRFPMAAHLNATNHAVMQSIAHSVTGRVNSACCVPHALKPLTLLLYDKSHDVSYIVSYSDMIATSCACK